MPKGNFDVTIENDDLARAVDEVSGCLTDWFPKLKGVDRRGDGVGQEKEEA